MNSISCHVLDTHSGRPGKDIKICLSKWENNQWVDLVSSQTNEDGRVAKGVFGTHSSGRYCMHFDTAAYYKDSKHFYPYVEIVFKIEGDKEHYHIPLLLNAHGYTTTHYEVLQIDRTASADDIKRAYRRLSMRLHPDRNAHSRAEDAFKRLGQAHDTLKDPRKRQIYDATGSDNAHSAAQSPFGASAFTGARFEQDISLDELFGAFFEGLHRRPRGRAQGAPFGGFYTSFGGRPPPRTRHDHHQFPNQHQQDHQQHRQHQQHQHRRRPAPTNPMPIPYWLCSSMLCLVVLLLFSSLIPAREAPLFSLDRDAEYAIRRFSGALKVPYYVQADFESGSAKFVAYVDMEVEHARANRLKRRCWETRRKGDCDEYQLFSHRLKEAYAY